MSDGVNKPDYSELLAMTDRLCRLMGYFIQQEKAKEKKDAERND